MPNDDPQTIAHLRSTGDWGCVVTVRVNSLKGVEAGRYYTERLPSYYLDGEEPPGRWWGHDVVPAHMLWRCLDC